MPEVIVNLDDVYSVDEAAAAIGISIPTAWRWVRSGKMIVIRMVGRTLVPKTEVGRLRRELAPQEEIKGQG
ncbi:MAG: helix-turn-helix domain-containing protein [Dehalococcoidales bacterium]|nr:helix-turn-helix domain-containing protein [Dehalococcoidales bacterium]